MKVSPQICSRFHIVTDYRAEAARLRAKLAKDLAPGNGEEYGEGDYSRSYELGSPYSELVALIEKLDDDLQALTQKYAAPLRVK